MNISNPLPEDGKRHFPMINFSTIIHDCADFNNKFFLKFVLRKLTFSLFILNIFTIYTQNAVKL